MSNLLKDRERFLKRAAAQPVVEKNNRSHRSEPKRPKLSGASGSSSKSQPKNFALIAKIVNHMKTMHLDGEFRELNIHEVLEECNSTSAVSSSAKQTIEDALKVNPKLKVTQQSNGTYKFSFRPPLEGVKDKKSFYKYLEKHHYEGLGGVMKEAVIESLPKAEKILKYHEEKKNIVLHTRPDKKVVVFYNDRTAEIEIDETFQKLWRSIPVSSIDEEKIQEYLDKQGITSVDDPGIRKIMQPKNKRRMNKKRRFKVHNDHVSDMMDFS